MVRSIFAQRVGRFAMAPAGAVAAATTTSALLGEKGTATASNRLVSTALKMPATGKYLMQQHVTYSTAPRLVSKTLLNKTSQNVFAQYSTTSRVLKEAAKRTSVTAEASPSGGFSLLQWYESHLQARPVQTKMVTGSILWGVGDWVAQMVPKLMDKSNETADPYDFARTGRAAFFGFAIHAPASHFHFNLLEWMTVRAGLTGLKIPVFKAFMEQFVYWSWISNSLYHGAMGAMQGQNFSQIYSRIADVLWETQKAQWVFWIPIQLLNFRFIPVRHQLNVVLLTSIVWTALLSAWYPPEKKSKEKEENREPSLP